MRLPTLFTPLLVTSALLAQVEPPTWTKHVPASHKAEVEFPSKVKEKLTDGNSQFLLETLEGKAAYLFMINTITAKIDLTRNEDIKRILDSGRDGAVASLKGKLLSEKAITLGKYPGRAYDVETTVGIYRARVYLTQGKLFQVVVLGPKSFVDGDNAKKFLDSLKINE